MKSLSERFHLAYRHWTKNSVFQRILVILAVFGPATITAMADNDASGVATYSIAGSQLGYPILFLLLIVTVLLGVTQEMGVRLTLITRIGAWPLATCFILMESLLPPIT